MRIQLPTEPSANRQTPMTGDDPTARGMESHGHSANARRFIMAWYLPPGAVQGESTATGRAGAQDRLLLDYERRAFDEIQAAATQESLAFWLDPQEDVYEDL
jgi:hypothetical protein